MRSCFVFLFLSMAPGSAIAEEGVESVLDHYLSNKNEEQKESWRIGGASVPDIYEVPTGRSSGSGPSPMAAGYDSYAQIRQFQMELTRPLPTMSSSYFGATGSPYEKYNPFAFEGGMYQNLKSLMTEEFFRK